MARKRYWAYAVDGGTAGAMDAIDGSSLSVGDICEVHNSTTHSIYYLAESAATENSPHIVTPDSNAGDKRWELAFPTLNADTSARGYWADGSDGANIHRLRDRVLIGDACDYDGNSTVAANSWLGDLGDGTATCLWIEKNATIAAIGSRGIGGSFVARATDTVGTGGGTLGVVGYAYNNLEDDTHHGWGGYFEGVRDTDGGNTWGVEIDITNLVESSVTDRYNPYNTPEDGWTVGLHIACGGGETVWPTSYDADCGLVFGPNGSSFRTGIVFRNSALTRDGGANGEGHAISLAYDHCIEWYEFDTDTRSCYIKSNITNASHDQAIIFTNAGTAFVNGNDETVFLIQDNQNTVVNYTYAAGAVSGTSPFISVAGSDPNIDLRLIPKGTAYVQFGTRTASSDAAITGYITIKDSGGTTRKLAVIT